MERATGIEPAFSAWEADVLPLNYARAVGSHNIVLVVDRLSQQSNCPAVQQSKRFQEFEGQRNRVKQQVGGGLPSRGAVVILGPPLRVLS
jgi:hypothetical protein